MTPAPEPIGRRERNKQQKLERIIAAAGELFAEHGVDDVTTQQIADRADIGAGTLFLYARTKGELLLLVQNAHYADALERGRAAAESTPGVLDAVMAILRPIVVCNRTHVENGRTYLREMAFGDLTEPHHAEALSISLQTEQAVADVLRRDEALGDDADVLAHVVTAISFIGMVAGASLASTDHAVIDDIRTQVAAVLARREPISATDGAGPRPTKRSTR